MTGAHGRQAFALLLSVLIHMLLLSLTSGGQGLGLPGFGLPWRDRRIEVPDLRIVLVPSHKAAPETAITPAGAPLPMKSTPPPFASRTAPKAPVSAVPPGAKTADAMARAAPPTGEAEPKRRAAAAADPAQAPSRGDVLGDLAPLPLPEPAVIDVKPRDGVTSTAEPATATAPASVISAAPGALGPETVMQADRGARDIAPARSDPETLERPPGPAELRPERGPRQHATRQDAVLEEAERAASEGREAERREAARQEAARREAARIEIERRDAERQEAEREEAVRQEAVRSENERQEAERRDAARREAADREAAQVEAERQAAERREAARIESERREAERQQASRQEAARRRAERLESARLETERLEAARRETAVREAAQVEAERQAAERREAARIENERREAERQEAVRQEVARREAARVEAERQEAVRRETARQEAARLERERQEAERQEASRREAARIESARQEAERREAAGIEAARQAAARQDAARIEAERSEAARREEVLRAIGRQLDEEAAQREAASAAARSSPTLPLSLSTARRARLWGRADPNLELVRYAEAWERKIQLNTPFDTVREFAQRPYANPLVTVAIRSNGSVESVTFDRSSGVAEVDEAIRRIVKSHEHYPAFPPGLADEIDVIEIRRTWLFDVAIRFY